MVADKILKDEKKRNKVFDEEDEAFKAVREIANYFAVEDWTMSDKDVQEWRWSRQSLTMRELENVREGIEAESKRSNRGGWVWKWTHAKGPDGKPIGGEAKYANEAFNAVSKLATLYLDDGEIDTLWKTLWGFVNENKYKEKKMKLTKSQLRKIIKEELENISEMGRGGWDPELARKAQIEEPEDLDVAADEIAAEGNADFYEAVAKLMRKGMSEDEALNIARSM